jgi:hypothetical protein
MRRGFGLTIEREQKAEQHLDSRADNEEKSTASVCLHLTRGAASQKAAKGSYKNARAASVFNSPFVSFSVRSGCRKTLFAARWKGRGVGGWLAPHGSELTDARVASPAVARATGCVARLLRVAGAGQLFDVVYEAEELPLPIDLGSTTQREPSESLVVTEIAKHGLHRAEALAVPQAPFW